MKQLDKEVKNKREDKVLKNVNPSDVVKVVQKYSKYVSSLSRKYYIVGGTTEDLFEEGVIGIIEACNDYNGESLFESKFDSFVKLCVKRQIFDAIKKANTGKNKALNESVPFTIFDDEGEEQTLLEVFADRNTSNDPLDLFIDKEKFDERMKKCEKKLSPYEKEVLKHYLDGEKQSEIAKNLNKEVKTIDNTLQRIKNKLK